MRWKEMLQPHLDAEHADHEQYADIARVAAEEGCDHAARILRDMAHEEKIHHDMIEGLMKT